jgi:hypothetical protein
MTIKTQRLLARAKKLAKKGHIEESQKHKQWEDLFEKWSSIKAKEMAKAQDTATAQATEQDREHATANGKAKVLKAKGTGAPHFHLKISSHLQRESSSRIQQHGCDQREE